MAVQYQKSISSKLALAATLVLAACWTSSASALDFPSLPSFPSIGLSGKYYGGAGLGGSEIDPQVNESGFTVTDTSDGGAQLFLGRDLTTRISIEGYYSNLGTATLSSEEAGSGRIDYSTIGASALFYLLGGGGVDSLANRTGLNIYARLGVGKVNNDGLGIEFNREKEWNWSGGFGAEYNMRSGFGLRTEIHNFDTDARVVSLNLVKRFSVKKSANRFPVFVDRADELAATSQRAPAKKSALINKDSDGDGVNDRDDLCDTTANGASVDDNGCDFTGVLEGVTFTSGSAKMAQEGRQALDKIVTRLGKNDEVKISVQAHTDNRGAAAANMALSRERAETVVRYLVDNGGIDLERITATGFGESRPLESNSTAAGRQANRRVEIKIAK